MSVGSIKCRKTCFCNVQIKARSERRKGTEQYWRDLVFVKLTDEQAIMH